MGIQRSGFGALRLRYPAPGSVLARRAHPGGERLDRVDNGLEADGPEQVERVLRAGQLGVDDRLRRVASQLLDEAAGDLEEAR